MPLSGTFDVLDFPEVLRLLARRQLTGRLHVRSRSFGANLFLEDGALVGADQSEHQAAASSGDVRGRLEEICFELLDAERGTFEFTTGRPSALPTTTRLKVDTVLSRARTRLQEWQELQEAIPSLELQPRLSDDLNANEVTIDQERWRVLTVVDGRRNLRAIGRSLGLSDFDVCRVIKGLLDEGVVHFDHRAVALVSGTRDTVAPVVPAPEPSSSGAVRTIEAPAAEPADPGAIGDRAGAPVGVVSTGPTTPAQDSGEGRHTDTTGEDGGAPGDTGAGDTGQPDEAPESREGGRRRLVRIRSRTKPNG